ncbi:nitrate reductase cytochrome c-type subunit [Sulfurimonas autotrophica]|uniref:Periplasmic nitrate reductase, electron transfer subunit n=1 Tax=Sulfurimonas autotrophica (strain ATCC BAA-671 / DSM 16294 / JCM 11897 / OK10) TaxID=563040 RepID=E0UT55_SULAO|nr:nitrate reductase cytochrome c-type subunit [Sulfurimonas autotrophica]ADN09296.1 periplasmic nitrate reductase [Sulfurimonas autotrophica DSM 16294]
MKILTKVTIGLATATLLLVGCNGANTQTSAQNTTQVKPILDESQLGYRGTTDLLKEDVVPPAVQYHSAAPGTSKKIARAFQDAPPMIPHDTTGMLPITKDNNQCLMCHMPDVASSMGATPIPVSHFTNFRPHTAVKGDEILKNGKAIKNTSSETQSNVSIKVDKKEDKIYAGRFNCSQCHAPQATNSLVDQNGFKPTYTAPDGASKSSWNQSKWMKNINTDK